MSAATDLSGDASIGHGDLERRRQVRLRLRRNLLIVEQRQGQRIFHVVKDPVSLRYFRLETGQEFAARLMDGKHTLEDIQKAFEQKFRPERLTLEELEAFGNQLLQGGLAENISNQAGRLLLDRADKQQRQRFWMRLANLLAIRLPLGDPDRLLTALLPLGQLAFQRRALFLTLPFLAASLGFVVVHWPAVQRDTPNMQEFFHWHRLLGLAVTWVLIKGLHELGHGLCCKAFGGEVHELGVAFLALFPSPFCNVTDSWTFVSKWQRIAVSAAGVYVELLLAGTACWVWWLTDTASLLHQVSFGVMVLCSLRTLLGNANPLMRLDGYYVLADWLDMPDLAETASTHAESTALRWLGVETPPLEACSRVRATCLVLFATASYLFRWLLMVVAACWLYTLLRPFKLGSLSYVFTALALLSVLAWPGYRLIRFLQINGRLPDMRASRLTLVAVVLLAVGLVVFLVPFPTTVRGLAVVQIEPDQSRRVVVPEGGGFLQEILVRDGQQVRAGDVLAILDNPRLDIKLRVNEAEAALRQQQHHALVGLATELGEAEGRALEGLAESDFESRTLRQQQALLQEQKDRLIVRAPCDGVVVSLVAAEDRGKWLDNGAALCAVGNDLSLRALVLIEASDHRLVTGGSPGSVRVHGTGSKTWPGRVIAVSQVEAKNIPAQLTERAGGDVAARQDPVTKAERPKAPHYLVTLRLREGSAAIHPGVLARVKIDSQPQTLWWRTHRYLATTFNWGL